MGSNRLPNPAGEVRKAHSDVQGAVKTAAERAIVAGHAQAKDLVEHGQWLPCLRENCAIPETTAQLNMKIARSGLESTTVADLGLKFAAQALVVRLPEPWESVPKEELVEWSLFALWTCSTCGFAPKAAWAHIARMKRNWPSASEWMDEADERYRKAWKMKPMPKKTRASWFAFLADRLDQPVAEIEAEIETCAAALGRDAKKIADDPK